MKCFNVKKFSDSLNSIYVSISYGENELNRGINVSSKKNIEPLQHRIELKLNSQF